MHENSKVFKESGKLVESNFLPTQTALYKYRSEIVTCIKLANNLCYALKRTLPVTFRWFLWILQSEGDA